jgi:acetyl esterase/lipase
MSPLDMSAPRAVHRISYGPSAAQFGDLRLPSGPGPHPVVIALHGGFWLAKHDLEHLGPLCDAVAAAGYATWSLEYRRVGEVGGGFPGTFEDVAAGAHVLAALAQSYPLDLGRVVALGHSAGGHLALWLSARHRVPSGAFVHCAPAFPVAGVVALAPIGDLAQAFTLAWGDRVSALVGGGPSQGSRAWAARSRRVSLRHTSPGPCRRQDSLRWKLL